ncbi:MAG: hypothetical protein ABI624_19035 [Casimicrobiaceae bacterium]
MKTRGLLCAVFAAAVVLGCQTPGSTDQQPLGTQLNCPHGQCAVKVTVTSSCRAIVTDFDQINVKFPVSTTITWTLVNRFGCPQFEFRSRYPDVSIKFKGPNAQDAATEFGGGSPTPRTYVLIDNVTKNKTTFAYGITVYPVAGSPAGTTNLVLDPAIFNDF